MGQYEKVQFLIAGALNKRRKKKEGKDIPYRYTYIQDLHLKLRQNLNYLGLENGKKIKKFLNYKPYIENSYKPTQISVDIVTNYFSAHINLILIGEIR